MLLLHLKDRQKHKIIKEKCLNLNNLLIKNNKKLIHKCEMMKKLLLQANIRLKESLVKN